MTDIEWVKGADGAQGKTWNPLVGCSIVSPGCTHCYAMRQAARIERMIPGLVHYKGLTKPSKAGPVWTGKVALAPDKTLLEPLRRLRPTTWFVNSMSDLWHESVPLEAIIDIIAVMALTKRHTYQVLTKRPARQREVLSDPETPVRVFDAAFDISDRAAILAHQEGRRPAWEHRPPTSEFTDPTLTWPLSNVWWGTSAERQKEADERIPDLLATPAAVRFVSVEPLLGEVNLRNIHGRLDRMPAAHDQFDALHRSLRQRLDWVIVGGESGPDARPMHPDWARSLRDQCQAAGVPFFFKQHGAWSTIYDRDKEDPDWRRCSVVENETPGGQWLNLAGGQGFHGERVVRVAKVGKGRAGRLLDGRTWDEMPAPAMAAETEPTAS